MKRLCLIFFVFLVGLSFSQVRQFRQIRTFVVHGIIIQGDTVPQISLKEVVITAQLVFASEEEAKKYYRLVRDVCRVYPYAILISIKVKEYDNQMSGMSKREKKAFMKRIEPELKEQFEKVFRSNTVDQAQVLIKLVDRETGNSSYHLIRQFKGGWNAFLWQSVARVVGTNLKAGYEPDGNDKNIERIVQQIEAGEIG